MTKEEFIRRMMTVCEEARDAGAEFNESVVIAQAALESRWGESGLTKKANNLFGIKAGKSWNGPIVRLNTYEYSVARGFYKTVSSWRKYNAWLESVLDYAKLISALAWYRDALNYLEDADKFLMALLPRQGEPGWATDPHYFAKVRHCGSIIEQLGGPPWE